MKRALISQIFHEWKENFWMVVELAIVSSVIWILATILAKNVSIAMQPTGYDTDNVYSLEIRRFGPTGAEAEEDSIPEIRDLRTLLNRLRELPYVESVGIGNNSLPYNYNYSGNNIFSAEKGDSVPFYGNTREMTPDMAEVLRLQSYSGDKTPSQLREILASGQGLLGYSAMYDLEFGKDFRNLIGRPYRNGLNEIISDSPFGAGIVNMKRTRFEETSNFGTFVRPINENTDEIQNCWEVAIRVKPGEGYRLERDYINNETLQSQRSVMLINLQPLEKKRISIERDPMNRLRLQVAGGILLLFIVYLGLLGTFWFRVQTRTPEIALRKVSGATSGQIFRRLLSEGMILLGIALIPAAGICMLILTYSEFMAGIKENMGWESYVSAGGMFALMLMTLVIILGILMPARRALTIRPAEALKDE